MCNANQIVALLPTRFYVRRGVGREGLRNADGSTRHASGSASRWPMAYGLQSRMGAASIQPAPVQRVRRAAPPPGTLCAAGWFPSTALENAEPSATTTPQPEPAPLCAQANTEQPAGQVRWGRSRDRATSNTTVNQNVGTIRPQRERHHHRPCSAAWRAGDNRILRRR